MFCLPHVYLTWIIEFTWSFHLDLIKISARWTRQLILSQASGNSALGVIHSFKFTVAKSLYPCGVLWRGSRMSTIILHSQIYRTFLITDKLPTLNKAHVCLLLSKCLASRRHSVTAARLRRSPWKIYLNCKLSVTHEPSVLFMGSSQVSIFCAKELFPLSVFPFPKWKCPHFHEQAALRQDPAPRPLFTAEVLGPQAMGSLDGVVGARSTPSRPPPESLRGCQWEEHLPGISFGLLQCWERS